MQESSYTQQLKLCPICLKKKLFTVKLDCCKESYFCRFCLKNVSIHTCPLCRSPIKDKESLLKMDKKISTIFEDFVSGKVW